MTGGDVSLLDVLTVRDAGGDRFVGRSLFAEGDRLFGGHVLGQALRSATMTVDAGRPPHSLHAYFIRPGRPGRDVEFAVTRTRDGRSFSTREVVASQGGEPILLAIASFHVAEPDEDWQEDVPAGGPSPDDVAGNFSFLSQFPSLSVFELRPDAHWTGESMPALHPMWLRARDPLGDDPLVHYCALASMSDIGVVGTARLATSSSTAPVVGASLDHAIWFHRPARADEWLRFTVAPRSNFGSRALAHGSFHDADGLLVASMSQEALLREAGRVPLP